MSTRLTAEHRRAQILNAAKSMSYEGGLYDWNLNDVADQVDVSRALVRYYFTSVQALRAEIIATAVKERDTGIVIQALAKCDPLVKRIKPALRQACAEHISGRV